MSRRLLILAASAALLSTTPEARQTTSIADLKTTAEASGFKSTSTYEDVVRFMKAVDAASPLVHYASYGTTSEGREMPLAVVGVGLKDASPAAVRATGRVRVHVQGNIHAGEVEGKESAQILLREFALGQHADWLKTMVFLVTPIFNADGNERFGDNRGRQNGPINGMGTRAQAQNININRDFMKLETPEGRAFAKLWNDYDPYIGFDLHTSNGSNHAYYLTYSPPLNPNTSDGVMNLMKNEWFPFVTKQIKTKHGWDTFYYGNISGGGGGRGAGGARGAGAPGAPGGGRGRGEPAPCSPPATPTPTGARSAVPAAVVTPEPMRQWSTFEHVPRFHNNYVGLRNRFALLSEAYSYATFEDRIRVTNYFMEEALNFASRNIDRIRKIVADADREALAGRTMGTRSAINVQGTMEVLMGEVEDELNPVTGRCMNRRKDVIKPEIVRNGLWFAPTKTEDVPAEFYVPAAATKALELLRAHGVQMRATTAPTRGLEQFTITANTQRPATNSIDTGTHGLRSLDGAWAAAPDVSAPAGTFVVPTNQPLGRLAFYLLAPTSDDGLTAWNYLDDFLGADAKTYPILRRK
jgi:hypothetical protein